MAFASSYMFRPSDEHGDGGAGSTPLFQPGAALHDDLAYQVEIWDRAAETVQQVLAVTVSASIGYSAFYAATREFPDRVILLRHKEQVLSRWSGHSH